jgi:hypothetical protein
MEARGRMEAWKALRHGASLLALLAIHVAGCGDDHSGSGQGTEARLETTRLCALVPARDAAAAAFPPAPPVHAFGTDLGFTYELNGTVTMLFGDTWQRIDICPLQVNDDSLATLQLPADDWPGFTARQSLPDAECPELTFALDAAGTSFAPIELRRWDGVPVPLGPLNTPLAGFHDGQREWAVFIVGGGQPCAADAATNADPCPTDLSPQGADLACGLVGNRPRCLDPTSTKRGAGSQAYYLHVAERVGPTSYVSRAMFLTNKYLNLTARAVRSFDPNDSRERDYHTGTGALLVWGRPGFEDQNREGEAPPYFMYHQLPFERDGDQIVFRPRYLIGAAAGNLDFSSSQADAAPLYTGELEPVNQAAVSFIAPLSRWLMIYSGSVVDFNDPDNTGGQSQPVRGAMYARLAPDPWGPWTDATPVLTEEQVAQDMVCGQRAPAGCLPPPDPPIRPLCIEAVDPRGGGALYGANIIDSLTRRVRAETGRGPAADVFWNLSTWHPYSVVLVRTHIELD